MKKIVLLFIGAVVLSSCGGDKKKERGETDEAATVSADKYNIIIDAIYEKNDSLVVFCKRGENWDYNTPYSVKVQGQPNMQKVTFDLPEGVTAENFTIIVSTNKEQDHLMVKNITVKNGADVIDGDNSKFVNYYLTDASFSWDEKNSRYILSHANKYPPAMIGNEQLEALLIK